MVCSCLIETSGLVYIAVQLTCFCMMLSFAKSNFRTDHNVYSETFLGGGWLVSLWYGFLLKVFSEQTFQLFISFADIYCTVFFQHFSVMMEIFVDCNFGGTYYFYHYYYHYIDLLLFLLLLLSLSLLFSFIIIFWFYYSCLFLAYEYLIKLMSIWYFVNIKSEYKKVFI